MPPYRWPAPPSTSMISVSAERGKPSTSRPTNCVVCASSAPAMPAMAAPSVYAMTSVRGTEMPSAGIRRSPSRTPRSFRPNGERTSIRRKQKTTNSTPRLYRYAVRPSMPNLKTPNSGHIAMSPMPSTPPVIDAARLATS